MQKVRTLRYPKAVVLGSAHAVQPTANTPRSGNIRADGGVGVPTFADSPHPAARARLKDARSCVPSAEKLAGGRNPPAPSDGFYDRLHPDTVRAATSFDDQWPEG